MYGLGYCDILKISDNEIQWLTGKIDFTEGVQWIKRKYPNIRLILVSMGKEGSRGYYEDQMIEIPAYRQNNTIETTGAGDTFCGCILHYICKYGLYDLSEYNLKEMLTFANAAASNTKYSIRFFPSQRKRSQHAFKIPFSSFMKFMLY